MAQDDRDRFENIMGGGFSAMEQQIGPEMQQTVVEMHRSQIALNAATVMQNGMIAESQAAVNMAQVKVLEAVATRNVMLSWVFFSLGFLVIGFTIGGVIVAIKA